jgi:hypothetical protein
MNPYKIQHLKICDILKRLEKKHNKILTKKMTNHVRSWK